MSARKQYVLDANVFIEAYRRYYAFEICSGFWVALKREHVRKRIFSVDRVRAELAGKDDKLSQWTKRSAPESLFKRTADKDVVDTFRELVNWVLDKPQFTADAKARFANVADGWLIAYAKSNGMTLVTHEEMAIDAKAKVPMPNLCVEFGVPYVNTFDMLRELKVRFGLRKHR